MNAGLPPFARDTIGRRSSLSWNAAISDYSEVTVPALADSLERLLSDEELAQYLATTGRAAIEQEFVIRQTSRQLGDLFAGVIGGRITS